MTATAPRFTIAGAIAGAAHAVWLAPKPLGLLLVANIAVTAFLSWLEAAFLAGTGLMPWLGRAVSGLGYVVIDATLGTMVMVVAIDALNGAPADLREAGRRTRAALAVSLPLVFLSAAVRYLAGLFIYQPISGEGLGVLFYSYVSLAELASAILLACTIGMATFAAVTGTRPLAAWGRSLRLVRKARWRLTGIAVIIALTGGIADTLAGVAASAVVPGEAPGPLWGRGQPGDIHRLVRRHGPALGRRGRPAGPGRGHARSGPSGRDLRLKVTKA
jgi:hypothetical protein